MIFMLRKMSPAELNYDIYNKELLTIVVTFQTQKIYMKDLQKITIFTNYKNLTNFYIIKELNRQQIH